MQIDFFYNCIAFIDCFYYSSLFFILSISMATKSFSHSAPSRLSRSSISFNRVRRRSSVFLWIFSFAAVWDTFLYDTHYIIPSDVFLVHTQQFICDFCRYRTFSISIALLFILSIFVNSTYTDYFTVVSQLF